MYSHTASNQFQTVNNSGERHSSYQQYAISQVNNEKPVIQHEREEQRQKWGQPLTSESFYSNESHSERNPTFANRLASSSSSLFDRDNIARQDNRANNDHSSHVSQTLNNSYRTNERSTVPRIDVTCQQVQPNSTASLSSSTSFARTSQLTSHQQTGSQHFHSVPYFHGFQFQTMPGVCFAYVRALVFVVRTISFAIIDFMPMIFVRIHVSI
jgi:hypothetical protein